MPQISGDELESVVERGRGYLQVGVGERHSSAAHLRLDVPTYPGNRDIEGKHSNSRQHLFFDPLDVEIRVGRAKSTFIQLSDGDGAGELIRARNRLEPTHVGRLGTAAQHFRDSVGIE